MSTFQPMGSDTYIIKQLFFTVKDYAERTDDGGNSLRNNEDEYTYAKLLFSRPMSKNLSNKKPTPRYMLKIKDNKLINPITYHSLQENNASFVDRTCKSDLLYVEVPKSLFIKYVTFLNNPSEASYRDVSRHIKDK